MEELRKILIGVRVFDATQVNRKNHPSIEIDKTRYKINVRINIILSLGVIMSYSIPMTFKDSLKLVTDLIEANGLKKNATVNVSDGKAILRVNKFGRSKIILWYKEFDNTTTFGIQSKDLSMFHNKIWNKLENTLANLVEKHGGHIYG